MTMTINDRIKISLALSGVTQKELSEKTGIPAWRVSDLANRGRVTAKELSLISKAIKLPAECLVGDVPLFDRMLSDYSCSLWR